LKVSSIEIEIFQKINDNIIDYVLLTEIVKPPRKLQSKRRTRSPEKPLKRSKGSTATGPKPSGI